MAAAKKTGSTWTWEQREAWLRRWLVDKTIDAKTIEKEAKVSPAVPYQWRKVWEKQRQQGAIANKQISPAKTYASPQDEITALRAENERLQKKVISLMMRLGEI